MKGTKYDVSVWCPDCSGQDYQGCFDGLDEHKVFDTLEEAKIWGEGMVGKGIWRFNIEEVAEDGKRTKIEL